MNEQEVEIDLREIMLCLMSNAVIVILSALIGALGIFLISSTLMEKKFESSTKIYVLNQQDNQTVTYSDLQTGSQLTKDYAELIMSRTVTTQVIADLDLQNQYPDMADIIPEELAEMIDVTTQQDTRILKITVTDTNPTRAQDIANAVRVAASNQIYQVMDIEAVNVVDYANLPERAVSPKLIKNSVIGALIGFVISIAIIIIRYLLDDTIKTPDDIERYLGLSVLASIPYDETIDTGKKGRKNRKANYSNIITKTKATAKVPTINS